MTPVSCMCPLVSFFWERILDLLGIFHFSTLLDTLLQYSFFVPISYFLVDAFLW
jgi:hypothetical protein